MRKKLYLSVMEILSHIIAVPFVALGPKEIPEQAEPVKEEGRMLGFIGKTRSREIVRDLDFVAILAISHHCIAVDTIHIAITRTCFGGRIGVQLERIVLDEGSGAVVVTSSQEIVIDICIKVGDHSFGDIVHISIVTRSRRTVIDHGNTTDGASHPGIHPGHIHLIHDRRLSVFATLAFRLFVEKGCPRSKVVNAHPPFLQ